jgi:hypothetical protein
MMLADCVGQELPHSASVCREPAIQQPARKLLIAEKKLAARIHPSAVMSGVLSRSRKRYGGLASLLENFCRSQIDPFSVISLWVNRGLRVCGFRGAFPMIYTKSIASILRSFEG